jgi:hypothetical protein
MINNTSTDEAHYQLWHCIQEHGKDQTDGNRKGMLQPMAHKYETQPILWIKKRILHMRQCTRGLETRHIMEGITRGPKHDRLLGTVFKKR